MNPYGGDGLRTCLPDDLFELYLETSRRTPERRQSIVLDSQLGELSAQPHLGPPNDGPRPHTGVHRRTLRQILLARLDDCVNLGKPARATRRPTLACVSRSPMGRPPRAMCWSAPTASAPRSARSGSRR